MTDFAPSPETEETCPRCGKPRWLDACDRIVPIDNRVRLLILQHPQEQDRELGTARMALLQFPNSVFRVGLSWPSLAAALGRPADPKRWAVLHLGAIKPSDFPPGRTVAAFDRAGKPLADQRAALAGIEGVVLFDGSWSQAKTLWWRNPWVLKARRIALNPPQPSLYGRLRREPRREGLSTLEAAGLVIAGLEGRPEVAAAVLPPFRRLLQLYRDGMAARAAAPAPAGEAE
jgi:DTW domain-containing protein YfiP